MSAFGIVAGTCSSVAADELDAPEWCTSEDDMANSASDNESCDLLRADPPEHRIVVWCQVSGKNAYKKARRLQASGLSFLYSRTMETLRSLNNAQA